MDAIKYQRRQYLSRMHKVLAYMDANLGGNLQVDALAAMAAFSPFHFQRQFSALFGLPPGRWIQLQRLRRASHALAFRDIAITEIALDSGYASPEAFSRAFQRALGQTPSAFRRAPGWNRWYSTFSVLTPPEGTSMSLDCTAQLRILETSDLAVALLRHSGDPRLLGDSVRRFISWRRAHQLPPSRNRTFNVFHTPIDVDPDDYCVDLCVATGLPVEPNPEGVVPGLLPGGRVAVVRHRGTDSSMESVFRWLYGQWLPASGESLRDAPPYLERLGLHSGMPAHEAEWLAFLPLVNGKEQTRAPSSAPRIKSGAGSSGTSTGCGSGPAGIARAVRSGANARRRSSSL